MAISTKASKILWGRAAGRCSKPDCRDALTVTTENGQSYLIGEMAHEVAQSIGGPRSIDTEGSDEYENLILLCPTHHRMVDKAPEGEFTVEELKKWKNQHEAWVDSLIENTTFSSFQRMAQFIKDLLNENSHYFNKYGPKSELAISNPSSNSHAIWVARKLDTILPNNQRIIKVLNSNISQLPDGFHQEAIHFKDHAMAYELNQIERTDIYPTFPNSFYEAICRGTTS